MSTGFAGRLLVEVLDEPVDKTKWFRTENDFEYISLVNEHYCVTEGTYTDFASIPRGFRWLIARAGRHSKPAVLHDWLCKRHIVPRKKADALFLEAMKRAKVGKLRRLTMWVGVASYTFFGGGKK
jgi:hypothetical protein